MTSFPGPLDPTGDLEFGEAAGWVDLYKAAPASLGLRVERIGNAIALICPADPDPLFNRVIGLGIREPASEAMLDRIVSLYKEAGIGTYEVCLSPSAQPEKALARWLEARGLRYTGQAAKCVQHPKEQVAALTDLRIEEAGPGRARDISAIQSEVFGMTQAMRPAFEACVGRPGWRFYLGYGGDLPVATGFLYLENGIGWLGSGATLESHRRRGAQGAIMAARVNAAGAAGCRLVVVETEEDSAERPNPSYHNMMRTGFQLAYLRATTSPLGRDLPGRAVLEGHLGDPRVRIAGCGVKEEYLQPRCCPRHD